MPSITLSAPSPVRIASHAPNPLPTLLHTPAGLALLEMQSTIHTPYGTSPDQTATTVGNLVFPLWDASSTSVNDKAWMKRVYFYVGKHQRLTGEVKSLAKAVAVVARKEGAAGEGDQLEIREIVRFKIVFSSRPEPVGEEMGV